MNNSHDCNNEPISSEEDYQVSRDIRFEIEHLQSQRPLLQSFKVVDHANREIISSRVGLERCEKHIKVEAGGRVLLLKSDDSWPSRSPISVTITEVDDLTYVILSGDYCESLKNDSNRFIFSNPEVAKLFKDDLLEAISSTTFIKSDHLIISSEVNIPDQPPSKKENKRVREWFNYVGYGLTTCFILLVGSIAVGYGWKLSQTWLR